MEEFIFFWRKLIKNRVVNSIVKKKLPTDNQIAFKLIICSINTASLSMDKCFLKLKFLAPELPSICEI